MYNLVKGPHITPHRYGQLCVESQLKVFDLRYLRPMSPCDVIMLQPFLIRCVPAVSSTILVVSQMGEFQLLDLRGLVTPSSMVVTRVNSDPEDTMTCAMDVGPSCQCLAFGDSSGVVHLWTDQEEGEGEGEGGVVMNPYTSQSTIFPDQGTYVYTMCTCIRTYVHVHIIHMNIMCIHTHMYIRTYMYTHMYIHVHTHVHTCTHTCTYVHTYMYTHMYIHVHTHVHTCTRYTHMHTYTHMYIRMYVHTNMYVRTCTHLNMLNIIHVTHVHTYKQMACITLIPYILNMVTSFSPLEYFLPPPLRNQNVNGRLEFCPPNSPFAPPPPPPPLPTL